MYRRTGSQLATVMLAPGDSLFFDGRVPHVPINRGEEVASMLVVYLLATN